MRILIVEDDAEISSALRTFLRKAGYASDAFGTLAHAWAALKVEPFDVVLLDRGLPDGDGVDLLHRIRKTRSALTRALPAPDLPVLFLTNRDCIDDRIEGLDSGANDYLVKPFDPNELLARLRSTTRRAAGRASPTVRYGDIAIDPATRTAQRNGKHVNLTATEFNLLLALVDACPKVLSKVQLQCALYDFESVLGSNAIEVHIHHLRRKVGNELIHTMRGVGYFVPQRETAKKSEATVASLAHV